MSICVTIKLTELIIKVSRVKHTYKKTNFGEMNKFLYIIIYNEVHKRCHR